MNKTTIFVCLLLAALAVSTDRFCASAYAGDVTVIDHDEGVAVTTNETEGTVVVEDDEGNVITQDSEGATHIEDSEGNVVSMDENGDIKSADIVDEDGKRIIIEEQE